MARRAITVHIIDNHRESRDAVKEMIAAAGNATVTAEFASYEEAWAGLAHEYPDLLIVEIGVRNGNGMEFIRKMRLQHPDIRILVYTHQDEMLYAERALRIGAHGYLMKTSASEAFREAFRTVMHGDYYVSLSIEEKIMRGIAGQEVIDEIDPEQLLSNRELEIFVKIGEGLSSREIAEQLGLSIKTVETHRAHIKRKLNIRTARDLVQQAEEWVNRACA